MVRAAPLENQQFSFWPEARAETVRSSGFSRSSKLKTA
jgi:hypothetical protein